MEEPESLFKLPLSGFVAMSTFLTFYQTGRQVVVKVLEIFLVERMEKSEAFKENIKLISPTELYNLLNQGRQWSRLEDQGHLLLLDARSIVEFTESHITTAKLISEDIDKIIERAEDVGLSTVKHIVLYDGKTDTIYGERCPFIVKGAEALWKSGCKNPPQILQGGYQLFSSLYPFMRTSKQMYTNRELEALPIYPNEIIPGYLYIASWSQSQYSDVLKHLQIKNCVVLSQVHHQEQTEESLNCKGDSFHHNIKYVNIKDSSDEDILCHIKDIYTLIDGNTSFSNGAILLISDLGISRSAAVAMAIMMNHRKISLKDAWVHVANCKNDIRPKQGFINQLSAWETDICGLPKTSVTAIF